MSATRIRAGRRRPAAAVLALVSTVLSYTVLGTAAPGLAQTPSPPITIAGPANDAGAAFLYAADMGFFAKAGLNVKVDIVNNAGTISAAVASGAVEVGSLTVPTVALANDRNVPLRIVAPAAMYHSDNPTSGLIVLNNSPFRKAADLNGKTIGVRDIDNMNYYAAKVWIDQNGGDSSTVRFIEIPETQALAILASGRIDAAAIANPTLYDAVHGGDARLFAPIYDAIGKTFLTGVYFTNEAYAQAHPDLVRRLSDVLMAAAKWGNENHAQSAKILEKYSNTPVPVGIPRVTYATSLRAADVQPVLDILYKFGAIHKPEHAADLFAKGVAAQ